MYINDLPDVCPELNVQMYADDAVIFIHGKAAKTIATNLTNALTKVQNWLNQTCLILNTKKTVVMMFTKKTMKSNIVKSDCKTSTKRPLTKSRSAVFLGGEELVLVTQFKYLGVILDSNLTFKKHIKKVTNVIKFNLQNYKQIRPFIYNRGC